MMQQVDQRNHPRFLVGYGAVAALTESKLGKISDISRGGLAFNYIDYENGDEVASGISSEVTIVHDPGFSLLYVPCKVIRNDYSLPEQQYDFLKMKKCCIQFYQLTPDQETQLYYFIENFAIGSSRETS